MLPSGLRRSSTALLASTPSAPAPLPPPRLRPPTLARLRSTRSAPRRPSLALCVTRPWSRPLGHPPPLSRAAPASNGPPVFSRFARVLSPARVLTPHILLPGGRLTLPRHFTCPNWHASMHAAAPSTPRDSGLTPASVLTTRLAPVFHNAAALPDTSPHTYPHSRPLRHARLAPPSSSQTLPHSLVTGCRQQPKHFQP